MREALLQLSELVVLSVGVVFVLGVLFQDLFPGYDESKLYWEQNDRVLARLERRRKRMERRDD